MTEDTSIRQKKNFYSMETNLVQHSARLDWKVNCAAARKGVLSSDSFSSNATCRTKWKMEMSFINTITNEMSLCVRRTDTDGDSVLVNIHVKLRNSAGVEFKEDSVKCLNFESGSEWAITFQKPSRQEVVSVPTSSADRAMVQKIQDLKFFVNATIEVKDCCPVANTYIVRKIEKRVGLFTTGGNTLLTISSDDPTNCFYFEHACQIDWKITNFSRYKDKIISPVFSPVEGCKTRWKIVITLLTGDLEEMQVSIHRVDDAVIIGEPDFYLCVKNSRNDKYYQEKVETWITEEWGFLTRRPSHKQPVLKPHTRSAMFRLDKDESLLVTAVITLNRCCGTIPEAIVVYA